MTFDDYLQAFLDSTAEDWITADGPIGLQMLSEETRRNGAQEEHRVRVFEADMVASFRHDLSIQMALLTGPQDHQPYWEEWCDRFPNKEARRRSLHLLWNGRTVFRQLLLSVDGGRCYLPPPLIGTLDVPEKLDTVAALVNDVSGGAYSYREYVERARLTVTEDMWPPG